MKLLFCGDVVGRCGRDAVLKHVPELRKQHAIDMVVVNGENSAGGFGITGAIAKGFFEAGVDILTTGNHVWRQKDTQAYIAQEKRLLRPLNFANKSLPGSGVAVYKMKDGREFVVIHAIGQLYMPDQVDNPFYAVEEVMKLVTLGKKNIAGIMVDFHGEASSERMAMGHMLDGRVSLVIGTHTHVPTADSMILPKGTAYQTDAGMCGDYNSVIGMDKKVPMAKFLNKIIDLKMSPAEGEATVCGVLVDISDETGLATKITPIRVGGMLSQSRG